MRGARRSAASEDGEVELWKKGEEGTGRREGQNNERKETERGGKWPAVHFKSVSSLSCWCLSGDVRKACHLTRWA